MPHGGPDAIPMMYGTAWKEDRTSALVTAALEAGFRAIDTANQRKHYFEAGVGEALAAWLGAGNSRGDLFVQTKFTYARGQDHRLPYDPAAPIGTQVRQSFARSLEHLGLERLDSLVLHGPSRRTGLGPDDHEALEAMATLRGEGRVDHLGVSNVTAEQLAAFVASSPVPLTFCQNRCYAALEWDAEVRAICAANGIRYQGFSLLTANRGVWNHPTTARLAREQGISPAAVIFRASVAMGMLPLTGTSDPRHMADDLAAVTTPLSPDDLATLQELR